MGKAFEVEGLSTTEGKIEMVGIVKNIPLVVVMIDNITGGRNDCGMGCDRTEVLIKAYDVGKIIGKGGTKIRELQNESGAHIQVCDH